MQSRKFDVVSFMSRGKYSLVYEVAYTQGSSRITTTTWAMKRFYLQSYSSVRCALRERNILVRLAGAEKQSPFLTTLLESVHIHGAPAFVVRKGCGLDLQDLVKTVGYFREVEARFYVCEIISGLEHLHAMQIVHLDVKPSNMLLDDSGHLFITDFDRSYDLSQSTAAPEIADFSGTPLFMAPEVMGQIDITPKADVWSLGVLVAVIMFGAATARSWLGADEPISVRGPDASMPLRRFLRACLTRDHRVRPGIKGIKNRDFFRQVKWGVVLACKTQPPYHPAKLRFPSTEDKFDVDPRDPLLLAAAYDQFMPAIEPHQQDAHKNHRRHQLAMVPKKRKELLGVGLTPEKVIQLFDNFDFANPHFLPHSNQGRRRRRRRGDVPSKPKCDESDARSSSSIPAK